LGGSGAPRPRARARALTRPQRLEPGLVDAEAVVGGDLQRQVDRQTVGVVKLECVRSGDPLGIRVARAPDQLVAPIEPLFERSAKALLLRSEPFADQLAVLVELGVLRGHQLGYDVRVAVKEAR